MTASPSAAGQEEEEPRLLESSPRSLQRSEWRRGAPLLVVLLVLAFLYRWSELDSKPRPGETMDEFSYAWVGLSLLETGRPESWSFLPAYRLRKAVVGTGEHPAGTRLRIVRPYLDHPPLFGLLAGAYARLTGSVSGKVQLLNTAERVEVFDVQLGRVRTLPLLLFVLTFAGLVLVARETMSFPAGLLALTLYSFSAYPVLQNRLLLPENLTTPLLLFGTYSVLRYMRGGCSERTLAASALVTTTAAVLCKLVSVAQAPALGVLLLLGGKRRELLWPAAGAVLGVALALAYGAWIDWATFTAAMRSQAGRFGGFTFWEPVMTRPLLVHAPHAAWLILLGWMATAALAFSRAGRNVFLVPVIYLAVHLYFAVDDSIYGWHLLPYLPFLFLALGWVGGRIWEDGQPREWLAAGTLLLPYCADFIYDRLEGGPAEWTARYAYGLALAGMGAIAFAPDRPRRIGIRVSLLLLLALVLWSEWFLIRNHQWPLPEPVR